MPSPIKGNSSDGIDIDGDLNSIIRNNLEDNTPFDIDDNGNDNNFVANECETSDPPNLCGA